MGKKKVVTAPSGVTVIRSGNNYTVSWKRGTNYSSQYMSYVVNNKITPVSIAAGATSKVITINKNLYYPKTNLIMNRLLFHVRGKASGKWSAGVNKEFALWHPQRPVVTATLSTEHENSTTFDYKIDWDRSNNDPHIGIDRLSTGAMFTNFKWWTTLLSNSELDPEQVVTWQETGINNDEIDEVSKTITESQPFSGNYSYTRYFKVVARGPKGDSVAAYAKHVYAVPNAPKNVKANAIPLENGSGYRVSVQWTADSTKARPIDSINVEYAVETPLSSYTDVSGVRKVTLSVPIISNWTNAATVKDAVDKNGDVNGVSFVINGDIPVDKCIFVRVVTKHDNQTAPSETVFASAGYGELTAPTSLAATINGNVATISVTNQSALTASFVGIYYRSDISPNARLIGIWPAGNTTAISVQFPTESAAASISFGAKAFVANYSPVNPASSGVTQYALSNILMESSGIIWDNRAVPKPPSKIGLSSPRTGVVRVTWDWSWTEANGVELSWADHDDAWESTDGPQTHVLESTRVSAWNVAGLEVGVWYFRIRLFKVEGDAITYGTYSDVFSIKLASSPATPMLTISPSMVAPDGKITCYWAFTATEGDEQVQADICEATMTPAGVVTYGNIVAKANNEQFKTLSVKDLGWTAGQKKFLAVRIVTASGEESNNWSVPKPVQVLVPPVATINSTSLETITIVDDPDSHISRQQLSLTEMPFDISASGAGESGIMTYIIERAADYHVGRPDESDYTGFEGETIAIIRKSAENTAGAAANYDISIDTDDENLIGTLDDGAGYNLIVIAEDSNGQTSPQKILPFEVHWEHQAVVPSATVEVDEDELAVYITPIQPSSGYATGDTCDIYRLSIDKPELIIKNAEFGTKYVDPYPALGNMGGHRIVYKTVNGDYITEDNEFAWVDYDYEDGDIIDRFATIINCGDDQVVLPYDLSLSSKWSKDFLQTKYLGGSVEGDWNLAVERTGSIKTRVAVQHNPELLEAMRRLATYPGICHVRTPDGSSYAANIDVGEDREEKMINKIASFSLDITRVDTAGFDGMTYSEWIQVGE